jgi:hypothetical protein
MISISPLNLSTRREQRMTHCCCRPICMLIFRQSALPQKDKLFAGQALLYYHRIDQLIEFIMLVLALVPVLRNMYFYSLKPTCKPPVVAIESN